MKRLLLLTTMVALSTAAFSAQLAASMQPDPAVIAASASQQALDAFARRVAGARSGNVSRVNNLSRNVNRNVAVTRNVKVNRNLGVNRAVLVRPVHPWVRRPYYGAVIAGVTLGTIIAATTVPRAPSPEVCWYWSNSSHTRGYWDYCNL